MPVRVPLCLPFRLLPGGARFLKDAREPGDARLGRRRFAVLLLLVAGLLSVVLPCADGADGHHDAPVPAAVSSVRSAPVAAASVAVTPVAAAPVAAAPAQAADGADAGHHHAACVPGPSGHLPQGRPAAGAEGAAVPAVLAGAVRPAAARRPAAGSGGGWHRPVRSGRTTLAALCRCRI